MFEVPVDVVCEDSMIPTYAHEGDAGADMRAAIKEPVTIQPGSSEWVGTGVRPASCCPNCGARVVEKVGPKGMRVPYRLGTDLFCAFEGGGFVHMGDMVEVASSFSDGELSSVGKLESATYGEDGFVRGVEVREADGLPTYMPNKGVFYRANGGKQMASWCDNVSNPVDADGEIVPLLVKKLYTSDSEALDVELIGFDGRWVAKFKNRNGLFNLSWFHLSKPDSWERLEEDARKAPREYIEGRGIAAERGGQVAAMTGDLIRRAKALAGVRNED